MENVEKKNNFFFRQKTLPKLPETQFLSFSDNSEPFESAPKNFFKKPPKSTPERPFEFLGSMCACAPWLNKIEKQGAPKLHLAELHLSFQENLFLLSNSFSVFGELRSKLVTSRHQQRAKIFYECIHTLF